MKYQAIIGGILLSYSVVTMYGRSRIYVPNQSKGNNVFFAGGYLFTSVHFIYSVRPCGGAIIVACSSRGVIRRNLRDHIPRVIRCDGLLFRPSKSYFITILGYLSYT